MMLTAPTIFPSTRTSSSSFYQRANSSAVSLSRTENPSLTHSKSSSDLSSRSSNDLFSGLTFLYDSDIFEKTDLLKLKVGGGPKDLGELRRLRVAVELLYREVGKPIQKTDKNKVIQSDLSRFVLNKEGNLVVKVGKVRRKPVPVDFESSQEKLENPPPQILKDYSNLDLPSLSSKEGSYKLEVDLPMEQVERGLLSMGIDGIGNHPSRPPKRPTQREISSPKSIPSSYQLKSEPKVVEIKPLDSPAKKNRMSMVFRSKAKGNKNKKGDASIPTLPTSSGVKSASISAPQIVKTSSTVNKKSSSSELKIKSNGEVKVTTPSTARPITTGLSGTEVMTPRFDSFLSQLENWTSSMGDQEVELKKKEVIVKPKRKPVPNLSLSNQDSSISTKPEDIEGNKTSVSTDLSLPNGSSLVPPSHSPRVKRKTSRVRDSLSIASTSIDDHSRGLSQSNSSNSLSTKKLTEKFSSRNYNSSSTSAESEGESDGGPSSDESEKSESVNQWRSSSASDSSQPPSSEFKSTYVKNRSFDSRRSSFSVDHSGTEDSDVSHQTESSNLSSLFDDAKGYDGKMPGMGRSTSSESVATTSSFRSAVEIK